MNVPIVQQRQWVMSHISPILGEPLIQQATEHTASRQDAAPHNSEAPSCYTGLYSATYMIHQKVKRRARAQCPHFWARICAHCRQRCKRCASRRTACWPPSTRCPHKCRCPHVCDNRIQKQKYKWEVSRCIACSMRALCVLYRFDPLSTDMWETECKRIQKQKQKGEVRHAAAPRKQKFTFKKTEVHLEHTIFLSHSVSLSLSVSLSHNVSLSLIYIYISLWLCLSLSHIYLHFSLTLSLSLSYIFTCLSHSVSHSHIHIYISLSLCLSLSHIYLHVSLTLSLTLTYIFTLTYQAVDSEFSTS